MKKAISIVLFLLFQVFSASAQKSIIDSTITRLLATVGFKENNFETKNISITGLGKRNFVIYGTSPTKKKKEKIKVKVPRGENSRIEKIKYKNYVNTIKIIKLNGELFKFKWVYYTSETKTITDNTGMSTTVTSRFLSKRIYYAKDMLLVKTIMPKVKRPLPTFIIIKILS